MKFFKHYIAYRVAQNKPDYLKGWIVWFILHHPVYAAFNSSFFGIFDLWVIWVKANQSMS